MPESRPLAAELAQKASLVDAICASFRAAEPIHIRHSHPTAHQPGVEQKAEALP